MSARIPILTFHALDDRSSAIAFPPSVFRRGLESLADRGYSTIRLTDVADCLDTGTAFPERTFVLTFDDGYRSVFDAAFPVLRDLGMTATVFLTVGARPSSDPDDGDSFRPADDERLPSMSGRDMLSWGEIRRMADEGIDLGGHTLTHPMLPTLSADAAEREIRESQRRVESAANVPVESFAYPDGRFDDAARDLVRRFYRCAVGTRLGLTTLRSDPWALERIETYYFRSPRTFGLIASGALPFYLRLRSLPRAVRRAAQLTLDRRGMRRTERERRG